MARTVVDARTGTGIGVLSGRRPAGRRIALGLAVLGTVLAGCGIGPSSRPELAVYGGDRAPAVSGQTSSSSPPTGPGGPGQSGEFDPGWQECGSLDTPSTAGAAFRMTCAAVKVPIDYSHPETGRLSLAAGRALAPGLPDDAPALVVMINNGPLDATLTNVSRLADIAAGLPQAITRHYAIIGIDIRGSGSSVRVNCFRDTPLEYLFTLNADLSGSAAQNHLTDIAKAFTFGCQDDVDANMVFFNTVQIADDLDALRAALGTDTLDLFGSGYGATAGAVYAYRYPGHVGRIVLDAPTDHSDTPSDRAANAAGQYERALQAFVADCRTQPACALGADPDGTISDAIAALDYPTDDSGSTRVNSGAVLWALVLALPDPRRWPALATAIADVAAGNSREISRLLDALQQDPDVQLSTKLMIDCNDNDQRLSPADLATAINGASGAAPRFGGFLVGLAALCRQWPSPEAPIGTLRAPLGAPVVVIGGVDDPAAPYGGVQKLVNQIGSAVLISYSGTAHTGYPRSNCVAGLVDRFLLDGTVPAAGTLCAG